MRDKQHKGWTQRKSKLEGQSKSISQKTQERMKKKKEKQKIKFMIRRINENMPMMESQEDRRGGEFNRGEETTEK